MINIQLEGNTCKVIDIILNPKVITMAQKNKDSLNFLFQLISAYVNQKYKLELNEGNISNS